MVRSLIKKNASYFAIILVSYITFQHLEVLNKSGVVEKKNHTLVNMVGVIFVKAICQHPFGQKWLILPSMFQILVSFVLFLKRCPTNFLKV